MDPNYMHNLAFVDRFGGGDIAQKTWSQERSSTLKTIQKSSRDGAAKLQISERMSGRNKILKAGPQKTGPAVPFTPELRGTFQVLQEGSAEGSKHSLEGTQNFL